MAETVKVIVRCRPMNGREKGLNCKDVVAIETRTASCSISNPADKKAPPKMFTFDGAYDVNSTTEQIYADIGFPLVEGVTEGYNGTIFAYGQTGCGKSFTMQGISDPASQKGVIPRAFDHIFETIQISDGSKYLVHASYLEIYNEEIRDLLGKDIKQKLDLKENPEKGIYVQSLSKHPCKNVGDCEKVMERGWKNRSTGATLMNADSSRSHSIFTIHLERYDTDSRGEHIKAAKLNLVDLAGSERQAKTGATGDRLKEATKINLSLSALGNVISALVDGKSTHIPYRDSKLTRLLQDSLGGNTKTLMVACLSPADNNYDETLSTLRYANRAKNIKNKPKINEDPKDAMLREYQQEIERLKSMLREESGVGEDQNAWNPQDIEAEKSRLRKEFENEMKRLKEELKTMKVSKEQMENEMNKLKTKHEKQMASVDIATNAHEAVINDEDEEEILKDVDESETPVHAVHLGTHKKKSNNMTTAEEASKRLQELEGNFVGGEQSNNEEVKERRRKKKKYAEERSKKLQEALAAADGDEIVAGIFKDVQDELKYKHRLLDKEKQKSESLRCEILDLQAEFEQDRKDYLDTIRKQEQQLKYFQAIISRIHPLIRRDCNFTNLERIKAQSEWDEINKTWVLPKVVIEKNHLPSANTPPNNLQSNKEVHEDSFDDYRFMQRLQNSDEQEIAKNYFKNSRAEEILNASMQLENNVKTRIKKPSPRNTESDESLVRKPARLEALPSKGKRKNKN